MIFKSFFMHLRIGQMHRVGLINKWLHDYLPMKDRCWSTVHANEVNNHTVNLDDMQGSFFVLFLGIYRQNTDLSIFIHAQKQWHILFSYINNIYIVKITL